MSGSSQDIPIRRLGTTAGLGIVDPHDLAGAMYAGRWTA
jgi:hypothetical protein